jgi:hypothetical protein
MSKKCDKDPRVRISRSRMAELRKEIKDSNWSRSAAALVDELVCLGIVERMNNRRLASQILKASQVAEQAKIQ